MRWEEQPGGWILRRSYTDEDLEMRFVGLTAPLSGGRWLWEVFRKDLAGECGSLAEAKKKVEESVDKD